jgi:hypothetical protein
LKARRRQYRAGGDDAGGTAAEGWGRSFIHHQTARGGTELRDLPLDDPSLVAGWWSIERGDGAMWRWTDGDASLQLDPGTIALDLRVRVAGCRPTVVQDPTWSRDRLTLVA